MKLTIERDLGPARADALALANAAFSRRAAMIDPVPALHAAKLRAAMSQVSAPFAAEAIARGLGAAEMCALIVRRAGETDAELLGLDAERQAIMRQIAGARSLREIEKIKSSIEG